MEELNRTERQTRPPLKQRYICFMFWCIQCVHSRSVLVFSQCTPDFLKSLLFKKSVYMCVCASSPKLHIINHSCKIKSD